VRTITLNEVRIKHMKIDYETQVVTVSYDLTDESGKTWDTGIGKFFVTMPPQQPILGEDGVAVIGHVPYPDDWFQLPASYIPTLVGLQSDADAALTLRLL